MRVDVVLHDDGETCQRQPHPLVRGQRVDAARRVERAAHVEIGECVQTGERRCACQQCGDVLGRLEPARVNGGDGFDRGQCKLFIDGPCHAEVFPITRSKAVGLPRRRSGGADADLLRHRSAGGMRVSGRGRLFWHKPRLLPALRDSSARGGAPAH